MKRLAPAAVLLVALVGVLWWLFGRDGGSSAASAADAGEPLPPEAGATKGRLEGLRARALARRDDAGSPADDALPPNVLARLGWGSGPGKLGRNRPEEANPEGPMSLTRDGQGNTWVLDQVNGRMVKLDKNGKPAGEVPLPLQTPQDVAFTKDGTAAVLDRLVDGAVALIGPDGKQLGELKLAGKGIERTGAITGVITDGDDIYVEREHADLVKLGDSKGKADPERPEVPGRPTRDGLSFISAGLVDPAAGTVAVTSIERATKQHRFTRAVPMGAPVTMLLLLDSDRSGVIYLGAVVEAGRPAISVLCLDPLDGRPLGRASLPANTDADETFRELTVLDEGGILFLHRTEENAQVMRADCR